MTEPAPDRARLSPADLLNDFRLLIYLFVGFRLILALVYQPYLFDLVNRAGQPVVMERGLSTFGDLRYYYQFAELSGRGKLPYRDYWHEFPPVWITLFSGLYALMKARGTVDFTSWATALGLLMLCVDVGNLILLRRLGARLHTARTGIALAWIYAVLAAPVIFQWWTFETLVVFFILLALTGLLEGRAGRSALAAALGALTKYTPILILPTVWRFYDRRLALRYTAITLLIVALTLGGLVAWGGRMAVASLLAQFNKASYESVWALLDGNLRTGNFPKLATRFDPATAYAPLGNDPVIPPGLRLLPFAALGLFLFTRPVRRDDARVLAFFSITLLLFFLWAQGWSSQWILTLMPLILLNFPNREGVLLCLVLSLLSFVEYPLLFMRTGSTAGEVSGALVVPYALVLVLRTLLLVGLAYWLYRRLVEEVPGD